ncbi:unnamed protein product [Adineta ricciae]|uniref:Uncharacterized protein n=1 Tax=Adineta ricciae TaxID=249248 RepID=A0A814MUY8_ADIRI|nr:unnamed protein product [Adineta ricciae]CAF1198821.1 unnamed protein product [Adineta ricciae]
MAQKEMKKTVYTEMIYLGPAFKPLNDVSTDEVSSLIQNGNLQVEDTSVQLYDGEEVRRLFAFQQHGFEYWQLNNIISEALHQLAAVPTERANRIRLRQSIIPLLTEWGHQLNLKFNLVVPLDTVYRDTNHKQHSNAFGPVCFAHVDFPSTNFTETLFHFKDTWKVNIELALGLQPHTLTDEQYTSVQVEKVVNIWMPLTPCPTKNTLAVMDYSSIDQFDQELQPYTAVRRTGNHFTALGVYFRDYHRWICQSDMKIGDAVVFDTLHTPHSAATIERPDARQDHRQSVEVRVLFLNVSPAVYR